jgi:hypothetical protein
MTSNSVWDLPELRSGGEFVRFDNIGDTITGRIEAIRAHKWDDGSVSPQILLTTDDGEERTVTAGQVRLKAALAEQRPEAGDRITITLSQVEKRSGGKTLKHFDVKVARGAEEASSAVAGGNTDDAKATAAAALSNLTPEQRKALGL